METEHKLHRKLVRSTIAEYEQARATGNLEVLSAMFDLSRAAYELETRFEKRQSAMTTAILAIVTAEEEAAKKLYLLALEQNRQAPDAESYVWRLYLGRRFIPRFKVGDDIRLLHLYWQLAMSKIFNHRRRVVSQ